MYLYIIHIYIYIGNTDGNSNNIKDQPELKQRIYDMELAQRNAWDEKERYIYEYIDIRIYIYIYINTYTCTYTYTHLYICIHVHIYSCKEMYGMKKKGTYINICTYIHTCIHHLNRHIFLFAYKYVCIHMHV
jgi:hypothetical protein